MSSQYLDGNNQRILHQVGIYRAVKYMDAAIIGRTCHQWVSWMEPNVAQSPLVIPQRLVWSRGQVEVEPYHATIETPDNHVIAGWMDVHGRDPPAS